MAENITLDDVRAKLPKEIELRKDARAWNSTLQIYWHDEKVGTLGFRHGRAKLGAHRLGKRYGAFVTRSYGKLDSLIAAILEFCLPLDAGERATKERSEAIAAAEKRMNGAVNEFTYQCSQEPRKVIAAVLGEVDGELYAAASKAQQIIAECEAELERLTDAAKTAAE